MGKQLYYSEYILQIYLSRIMGWVRCSLGFSLLRSSLMCPCGSRSRAGSPGVPAAVDLAVAEGHLATSDV